MLTMSQQVLSDGLGGPGYEPQAAAWHPPWVLEAEELGQELTGQHFHDGNLLNVTARSE